jgi:hypothetical protein
VQAKNVVGVGLESLPTRIVVAVAPNPPTLVQTISQSSTQITIGWIAVTGASTGGSPITSYEVWWKSATDQTYALAGLTSASTLQ